MIVGVGLDLERISRFQRIARRRKHLVDQVYTHAEQEFLTTSPSPLDYFAACFAIKEASFKALGQGWLESSLFWTDIELLSPLSKQQLEIRLSGAALTRMRDLGGSRAAASIALCGGYVLAQIILSQ